MVYEPQEDSFLLREFVKRYASGVVLDMGTGSGLQAREAAHSARTSKVFAVDVDSKAIEFARAHANRGRHKKITWLVGDLFSPFKAKKYLHFFDTIIFNPPYLPQDYHVRDIALEGGKRGSEVIERFLKDAHRFLKRNGKILLVFSSLTPNMKVIMEENLFVGRELGKRHLFFEDIVVWELTASPLLGVLHKKGICNVRFFAKGKRGVVFVGDHHKKKVAMKVKRESSAAQHSVLLEANMLKELNKHGIGPKYLFHTPNCLVYEFVKGTYLTDVPKNKLKSVCKRVFEQCFQLDLLHVNKQEMTRPYKHVIVGGRKVTLIDFERARKSPEAHNVTQFCQFVQNHVKKGTRRRWINIAKEYSKSRSKAVVKKMIGMLDG